jgi:phosphoserine phosphatase RsbU/P
MALISAQGNTTSIEQLQQLNEELMTLNQQLYKRNSQIEQELYVTRQLQQSLLPSYLKVPGYDGLAKCHVLSDTIRITGIYLPCDSVGGDLYDVAAFNRESQSFTGIALADVSGHGVPASFITAIFKASLYRATNIHEHPGDVLFHVNNELMDMVTTGDYVTALYCRLLDEGKTFEYAGAGHPYPALYRHESKQVEMLKENGTPLVWMKDMEYTTGKVTLNPGDKVLTYTDGVTEMQNCHDELFGEDRLRELFLAVLASQEDIPVLDLLLQGLSDFTQGEPLHDDLSMVLVEHL